MGSLNGSTLSVAFEPSSLTRSEHVSGPKGVTILSSRVTMPGLVHCFGRPSKRCISLLRSNASRWTVKRMNSALAQLCGKSPFSRIGSFFSPCSSIQAYSGEAWLA